MRDDIRNGEAREEIDESLNRLSTCRATGDEGRERFSKLQSRLKAHRIYSLSGDRIQQ